MHAVITGFDVPMISFVYVPVANLNTFKNIKYKSVQSAGYNHDYNQLTNGQLQCNEYYKHISVMTVL